MDKVERWASKEAQAQGVDTPHRIAGFKAGVRAAYEALQRAGRRRKQTFVPDHEDDIWDEFLRRAN